MKRAVIAFVFILLSLYLISTRPAFAADPAANWRNSSFKDPIEQADQGSLGAEAYLDRTNLIMNMSTACRILNDNGIFCPKDNTEGKTGGMLFRNDAVGLIAKGINTTFTVPPASTYAFIRDAGQSLGFIPRQAYAQGVGFTGLSAILPIWKLFRNISYFILAIVMVVIGFMIMFRKKIDAHTVVSVQNALPRIIVTLILITFSYAIVGVMIDLMYLAIAFIVTMFTLTKLLPDSPPSLLQLGIFGGYDNWQKLYGQGGLMSVFGSVDVNPIQIVLGMKSNAFTTTLAALPTILSGAVIGLIAGIENVQQGAAPATAIGSMLLGAGMPIVYLLFALAMLFLFIRLLVLFASTYVQIILALLFGPIQILFGALPGNDSFASWLKNLLANIAVFPIATTMFLLANVFANFANGQETGVATNQLWITPYTSFIHNTTSIAALIALGMIFTIPTIAGQVKEMLKAKAPIAAGPGAIIGPFGSAAGQAFQLGYQGSMIKSIFRHEPHPSGPIDRSMDAVRGGMNKVIPGGGGKQH
jgi:hypothetical protein